MNRLNYFRSLPEQVRVTSNMATNLHDLHTVHYLGGFDISTPDILAARGLVLDEKGNTIARPYDKFFNYHELENTKFSRFSEWEEATPYTVTEKIDGSLVIMFYYHGAWRFGSSNTTDHMFRHTYVDKFYSFMEPKLTPEVLKQLKPYQDKTIMLEYVDPMQSLVIHYNTRTMYLHGIRDIKSGVLSTHTELLKLAAILNLPTPKEYSSESLSDLLALQQTAKNIEGYVVTFNNGYQLKIKTQDYWNNHFVTDYTFGINNLDKKAKAIQFATLLVNDEFDDLLAMLNSKDSIDPQILAYLGNLPTIYGLFRTQMADLQKDVKRLGRKDFALAHKDSKSEQTMGFYVPKRDRNHETLIKLLYPLVQANLRTAMDEYYRA